MVPEAAAVAKRRQGAEEAQFAGVEGLLEIFQEQTTEETSQHPDRQEEIALGADSSAAVGRETTSGDNAIQMRMMEQHLFPRVEQGKEAEPGAEVVGIGGCCKRLPYSDRRLRRSPRASSYNAALRSR
jgi:hypothetical protein